MSITNNQAAAQMINMTSYSAPKIQPLSSDNYESWRIQMQGVLVLNDLWPYVNGTLAAPSPGTAGSQEWAMKDEKAKFSIILNILPSELHYTSKCKSSKEVWDTLQLTYQPTGATRLQMLIKKLMTWRMEDGCDVREQMKEFLLNADRLREQGVTIDDKILSVGLLLSLPRSFNDFKTSMETRDEVPTLDVLKIKILERYDANQIEMGEVKDAFYVSKGSKGRNLKPKPSNLAPNPQPRPKCTFCKRNNHTEDKCFKKHGRPQRSKPNDRHNVLSATDISEEKIAVVKSDTNSSQTLLNWCLDSGCTSHTTNQVGIFTELDRGSTSILGMANQDIAKVEGRGTAKIEIQTGNGVETFQIPDALFVPSIRMNLMSVSKITDKGYRVLFDHRSGTILNKKNDVVAVALRQGDLYYIQQHMPHLSHAANQPSKILDWHQRFGHLSEGGLKELLANKLVFGMHFDGKSTIGNCEICLKGKMATSPYPPRIEDRTKEQLEIVYSDVCGPMRTDSFGGAKYFVTFIDDKTRWCEVRFMKHKSNVLEIFKAVKATWENQSNKRIKFFHTDNGKEYDNKDFDNFLSDQGIQRRLAVPYCPPQNGVAERMNRTLLEMARCMILDAGLSPGYWAEAVATAAHIRNRCPTRALGSMTPFQARYGRSALVSYFRRFGSRVQFLNTAPNLGKFEPRTKEGIFVGYSDVSKAYRIYEPTQRKLITSRDVKFLGLPHRSEEYEEFFDVTILPSSPPASDDGVEAEQTVDHSIKQPKSKEPEVRLDAVVPDPTSLQQILPTLPSASGPSTASSRQKRGPGRPHLARTGKPGRPRKIYSNATAAVERDEEIESDPTEFAFATEIPFKEAIEGSKADKWKLAIKSEFESLLKNRTWEMGNVPTDRKEIGCRFVLREKYGTDGQVERHKARLVAKGFTQVEGLDYEETFAPVARLHSVRTIISLAAQHNLHIHQMDVATAYLNGKIKEEIYMRLPDSLEENLQIIVTEVEQRKRPEDDITTEARKWLKAVKNGKRSCRLKKALYGLKQSGREWYQELDTQLRSLVFEPTPSDPCIYVRKSDDDIIYIVIYVDDLLLVGGTINKIEELKKMLATKFVMRDLGEIRHCLGLQFTSRRKDGRLVAVEVCQTRYIHDALRRFNMENCKAAITPLDANQQLLKPTRPADDEEKNLPYQSLIGTLMYLAVGTRPDISYAVSHLSQFNTCFRREHWKAAKRVLRYLKGTIDLKLTYHKTDCDVIGFADADWASDANDRKSYSGHVFIFGGAAIYWESRKQRSVALSSTESEYVSLSEASKTAIYLRNMLCELCAREKESLEIFCDNQGARQLALNPVFHSRTKHIDVRYHFVRDEQKKGSVTINYLPTEEMTADALTKALHGPRHRFHVQGLGLRLNYED